jgi:hypothetical protein
VFKLANRLGRSIAKLRNTHVLNVIVTSGTQKRLRAGKASIDASHRANETSDL